MSALIAKEPMGFCSCGTLIEPGQIIAMVNGEAIHVDCKPKQPNPIAVSASQSSGLLFDDPVRAESERVKEKVGAVRLAIHGQTYSERRDKERLTKHLLAVFELMKDGEYRDTELIAATLHIGATSAHARLRQLRAIGHSVPKRWVKGVDGSNGHFEYALIVNRALMGNEWESQRGRAA